MTLIQASIPLFFLLIAVELLYAQLGRRSLYRLNDSISDLAAGTLSQIAGIATKVLLVGAYDWTFTTARVQRWSPLPAWPDGLEWLRGSGVGLWDWRAALGWVVAFLAVDLAYYWFHRVSHEVNLFWAGHVVHHSSEEYNLAVALRQTAVGGVLSWVFYMPLALLGMTLTQFAVCYALNLIYQFWIHTRAIGRLPRWAEAVLNTPSHHRVHHGVNPEYQDRNYAGVLIVWDRWFGTFTEEQQEPVYGLTTPLASWNPLWAQVHHYVTIGKQCARATSWRDRWHYVFGAPGWRPADAGGPAVVPPVSVVTFLKFDPAIPSQLAAYALVHFVLALPAALWLLAKSGTMAAAPLVAGCFYVVLTLTNVGGVLEARRWAHPLEQARLWSATLTLVVAAAQGSLPVWTTMLAVTVALGSSWWLWRARRAFTTPSDERMDSGFRPT